MSYLVLARKYRPQNFNELVGQDFASTSLKNAIALSRVSHAYLFTGARGVGKTSAARIFAKALNCLNPIDSNPCNECEHCKEITSGTAMDVLEIDGASNRGVDEIRQLREAVKFLPVKYKYKVYIVDEVHMLTGEAANALLKTLEEPPSYVIFIFATTDSHKMLPTILSRCQRYDFKKIPFKQMHEALEKIYTAEGISFDSNALNLVIRQSEGCMRDALSFSDQIISYTNGNVTYDAVAKMLGVSEDHSTGELFEAVLREDRSVIDDYISRLNDSGVSFLHTAEKMINHTRNLLLLVNGAEQLKAELTAEEIEYYSKIIAFIEEERLFALFQMLQKLHNDLKYSSFSRYTFEFAMYKAASISRIIPLPSGIPEKKTPQLNSDRPENKIIYRDKQSEPSTSANKTKHETVTQEQSKSQTPENKQNDKAAAKVTDNLNVSSASPKEKKTAGESVNTAHVNPINDVNNNSNKSAAFSATESLWHSILTELKNKEAGLASSLFHSRLEPEENGKIILSFSKEREFNYKRTNTPDNIKVLSRFISEKLGRHVDVEIRFADENKKSLAIKKEELESVYETKIREDFAKIPTVKEFMEKLGVKQENLKIIKNN